ncbi:MAG: acylphosphatase [Bacteroidales bacterium]
MTRARRFVVNGRVQRVGYRAFVYDHAVNEGLGGHVRNQPDGSVEIVAEGESEALMRFERAIRQGPIGARVDEVEVDELAPTGRHSIFYIKG